MITSNVWKKVKREAGLYLYRPTGQYFARVRFKGRLYRKKLNAGDLALAQRKLREFKNDLSRTDATKGNASLSSVLDDYAATLTGAKTTLENKRAIVTKLKQTFFGADSLPLRTIKPTAVAAWLSKHYGDKSASSFNQALTVCRDAFSAAIADRIVTESPATGLRYKKPATPIRTVPTSEQFKAIVDDIRSQRWAANAGRSADFVQFLGLSGIGTAEASALTRADVDLKSGRIVVLRKKTSAGFVVPVFPQLRPLLERLCASKKPHERLFKVHGARKAISHCCRRLGFMREAPDGRLIATFTARSFRRLFVTNCLEKGIDVQTVSRWQGHRDGGRLILSTYGFVTAVHSQHMAQLLTDELPANVLPITAATVGSNSRE